MQILKAGTNDTKRLLGIYIYYRLSLGLLLGVMHWTGLSEDVFGSARPDTFSEITLFYIVLCSLSIILYRNNKLKADQTHLIGLLVVDFIALVIMIYASGVFIGGLGYLLLIPMAVGSTFLSGQGNIGLAAFGTILMLTMSLINIKDGIGDSRSFFSAGVTGVLLFVTAIAFRLFSDKVQASQYTAKRQTEHADYLQLISQRIVETMRTGIIVVDRDLRIRLINHSASVLLTVNNKFEGIVGIDPIYNNLQQWQNDGVIPTSFSFSLAENQTVKVSFAPLEDNRFPSIMLFIENMQRLNQEAQQLKLASLGRLTASIAHEIRNPLGAISHASQLLSESGHIIEDDQQLVDIVYNHSQRINYIINNILEFSRRNNAAPQIINLNQWATDFKYEYLQSHPGQIEIIMLDSKVHAKVDPNHLYQIISNLSDNGMRYSYQTQAMQTIKLHIGIQAIDKRPFIEVIDFGKGIDKDKIDHIFEPFYTTEYNGSGLGLYLCKELCEANQATLSYSYDNQEKQSIFTVVLCHPKRSIELQ